MCYMCMCIYFVIIHLALFQCRIRPQNAQEKAQMCKQCTTRQTVAITIARYQATGLVEDRHRSGRPKSVTEEMYHFIVEAMAKDDELTARKLLRKMIEQFGPLNIPKRTVARARHELWLDLFHQ